MIRHIVLFRLSDRSAQSIRQAADVLRGLAGKVPQLLSLEVGVDVLRAERSYDIALTATFDSLEDLQAYQVHPEHQVVAKYMNRVRESVAAADYEVG
jgi:hypothetical protein